MDSNEIYQILHRIISDALWMDEGHILRLDTNLFEHLNAKNDDLAYIAAGIQYEFRINVNTDDLISAGTVGKIIEFIENNI